MAMWQPSSAAVDPLVVGGVADLEDAVAAYRAAGRRVPIIFLAPVAPPAQENGPLERHGIHLDPATNILQVRGREHILNPKSATVLAVLMRNAGRLVSRESVIAQTWGFYRAQHDVTLCVLVHGLRKKLDCDPQHQSLILTLHRGTPRSGYLFRG
jgi:two-component system KDP operon response regulator KdpE